MKRMLRGLFLLTLSTTQTDPGIKKYTAIAGMIIFLIGTLVSKEYD